MNKLIATYHTCEGTIHDGPYKKCKNRRCRKRRRGGKTRKVSSSTKKLGRDETNIPIYGQPYFCRCGVQIDKRNKTGRCKACYDAALKNRRDDSVKLCLDCTVLLGRDNKSGRCKPCYQLWSKDRHDEKLKILGHTQKFCSAEGCGKKLERRNKSGLCVLHYRELVIANAKK